MRKEISKLTVAQFAKLHGVNKRTLHYYDDINLFSPNQKLENGYRMYDLSQSLDFEYIRMLKELDLSIEEIKDYYNKPTSEKFLTIATNKISELDHKIQHLNKLKTTLELKQKQLLFCNTIKDQLIQIETLPASQLSTLPLTSNDDLSTLFTTFKNHWNIEEIRNGIGGFIHLDKIKNQNYDYDGFFTYSKKGKITLPEGQYLCGYQKGPWEKLPQLYEQMLTYATNHQLVLTDYAYEIGLNEFAISSIDQYITKIIIPIK